MEYGLLGGKLSHSLSPKIHLLFFKYTGIEGNYSLLETDYADLKNKFQKIKNLYQGINVTIPHKVNVLSLVDKVSSEVCQIGAINTIKFKSGIAYGYNTDYFGFARLLEHNNLFVKNKTVAVLGSGGAAYAVIQYLLDQKAKCIYLVTRNTQLGRKKFIHLSEFCQIIDYDALNLLKGDILINCTPVGMYPNINISPVSSNISANFQASVDLIYNPKETLFLQQARKVGKQTANGLFMLVAQAVAAQEIWQDKKYSNDLILRIMADLEKEL